MNRLSFLTRLGALIVAPLALKAAAEEPSGFDAHKLAASPDINVSLPPGQFYYRTRYITKNGDWTNWSPDFVGDTHAIVFRIDNQYGYDSMEVERRNSDGSGRSLLTSINPGELSYRRILMP